MKDKLKYLFFFLLVTTAAYAGSTLFLYYLDREIVRELPFPVPPRSSAEKNVSPTPSPAEDSKAVAKNPLSLEQEEVLSKKTSSVQKKPTLSSLGLKLLGTVVNEKGLSWAIIQDLDRDRQDLVTVGSLVAGVRVLSIGRDRVVLSVNGREEILLLGSEGTRPAGSRKDQASKESTTSTYVVSREVVKENLDNLESFKFCLDSGTVLYGYFQKIWIFPYGFFSVTVSSNDERITERAMKALSWHLHRPYPVLNVPGALAEAAPCSCFTSRPYEKFSGERHGRGKE